MATSLISNPRTTADQMRIVSSPGTLPGQFTQVEDEGIHVSICHSWQRLEEKLPAWESILRENSSLSIFSTPEWLGSWWKAFGARKQMVGLIFSRDNCGVVGLIPLYLAETRSRFIGMLKCLRLVGDGSGDSDNLDFIVRPGFEKACAKVFLRWLKSWPNWDVCSINTLREQSRGGLALLQEIKAASWPILAATSPNSAVPLPQSWPLYVKSLSPNFRPLVERYPRRLAQRYQVHIHRCETREELSRGLSTLFVLHQKRWNSTNQPGSFGSGERREFYRLMGSSFLQRGWLEFWSLELNGAAVATQFCFRYRDTVSILQEGFEPKYSADKVGYALRTAMLRHFIETGVKRYDFLGGLATHKQNWGAEPGNYLNLQLARPRSRGALHLSWTKSKSRSKEWLRRTMPRDAWNVLRWLKLHLNNTDADAPSA